MADPGGRLSPARATGTAPADEPDPRRWAALAIAILAIFIVVLDNTVLNVSIPTILRDLHTTLPSLEWVITGYALTFASLLIVGGRLGDVYGHRRIFIIGLALFGVGSLLASVSTSVGQLILGEAIIEGIGASLMLPTTLAILSGTFTGRERATAFAAWGDGRSRGRLRAGRGRIPHHLLLVAVVLPHQRHRGPPRHRRRPPLHEATGAVRPVACASISQGRYWSPPACSS